MNEQAKWWCGMLIALMAGIYLGLMIPQPFMEPKQAQPEAAPVFAAVSQETVVEDNLFAQPAQTPGFSIEVLNVAVPQARRVLIYHTHTYEAFEQAEGNRYQETEKWRTADSEHNMIRVGEELASLLRALGVQVTHDITAFEPPVLSTAYTRSLEMLEQRIAGGETYDLYIDLHRDAYSASYGGSNTVSVGGTDVAKLMLLIGKGEGVTGQGYDVKPDWEKNLAIAQAITDDLNSQASGLCRDVHIKAGRFNQHVAPACVLVEAGNNHNTLREVLAAMPYLADAIVNALEDMEARGS